MTGMIEYKRLQKFLDSISEKQKDTIILNFILDNSCEYKHKLLKHIVEFHDFETDQQDMIWNLQHDSTDFSLNNIGGKQ